MELWNYRDQVLITIINTTLSPSVFNHFTFATTTRELWLNLETRYFSKTWFSVLELKYALYIVKKETTESVEQYFWKVEVLVNCLATAAVKINDEVSLLDILNGLLIKFSAFRISIITRDTNLSLAELEVLLDAEAKTMALLSRWLNQLRWQRPPSNTLVATVVESPKEVAAVGFVGEEGMGRGFFQNPNFSNGSTLWVILFLIQLWASTN